ncbi:MAG: ParB/RepB/Spo0J family partition protein [Gallionella sp.]|nr:ParB/RepB/Spo0J family partition protein [Gallionella sp.]
MSESTTALAVHQVIALDILDPSPTNPRKRFDEAKLAELATSIKQQGILQPLLVREGKAHAKSDKPSWPFSTPATPTGRFEIIAGERRYRAAKLAGLSEIPCFVRNLTDTQVLHAQVIENLQRDDLHPLEEAEGYEKLMKEHGSTADSLAVEIGKSKAYIYARLKLTSLCPEARKAFYDDELDASTALLIARIPVQKLQIQATEKITEKNWQGDLAMSFRTARDYIQREYMTDLERAPFPIKDTKLIEKAGACTDCAKRTGNQPELFDDVKSKDICTDTVCFQMKRTAHILAIQKEAEAKGQLVITGKDAKKIMPWAQHNTMLDSDSGYAKLSDRVPNDDKNRTWEQALGKKVFEPVKEAGKPFVQKTFVENTHSGELVPIVKIEDAVKALREAGFDIKLKATTESANRTNKTEEAKLKAKVEQVSNFRERLFTALHNKVEADMTQTVPHVADGLYRILAERMLEDIGDYRESEYLAKRLLPHPHPEGQDELFDALRELIHIMTTQQHFLLMIDTLMIHEVLVGRWNCDKEPAAMLGIAKEIGIDAAEIEKEVASEINAAAKKTILAEGKKPAVKKALTPLPAAQAQDKGVVKPQDGKAAKPKAKMKAATAA